MDQIETLGFAILFENNSPRGMRSLAELLGDSLKFIVIQTVEEMDLLEKGDSCRSFNGHGLILSNFTHDGTSVCRHFRQLR